MTYKAPQTMEDLEQVAARLAFLLYRLDSIEEFNLTPRDRDTIEQAEFAIRAVMNSMPRAPR